MSKQEHVIQVGRGKYRVIDEGPGWALVEVPWEGKRKADGERVSGTTTAKVATNLDAISEVYGDRALDLLGRQAITDAANRARSAATEGKTPEASATQKHAKMTDEEKQVMLRLIAAEKGLDLEALGL